MTPRRAAVFERERWSTAQRADRGAEASRVFTGEILTSGQER
jgi:hypothetical protein